MDALVPFIAPSRVDSWAQEEYLGLALGLLDKGLPLELANFGNRDSFDIVILPLSRLRSEANRLSGWKMVDFLLMTTLSRASCTSDQNDVEHEEERLRLENLTGCGAIPSAIHPMFDWGSFSIKAPVGGRSACLTI